MRSFELTFYLTGRLVSRTLYQGMKRGAAVRFARMLLSVRNADSFECEEI